MPDVFTPLKVGELCLAHRIIMAPLTRYRAPNNIPGSLMVTYYEQRASEGGLIISETTIISETSGIPESMPRIDTPESVAGWIPVVEAVHRKNGFIFCQLNHLGRVSGNPQSVISASGNKVSGDQYHVPRQMNIADMQQTIDEFVQAADSAVNKCGFDGVELHGANGYLLDQFIEDSINIRTDEFGGSIENRVKFPLMVLDAVIAKVGAAKVGYRISPWDVYQEATDSDPETHFSYFCDQLELRKLAFVHVVEARSDANGGRENDAQKAKSLEQEEVSSVSQLKQNLPLTPLLSAGGWNSDNFADALDKSKLDALVFGRYFISNPNLPEKLKQKEPLTPYNRATFYTPLKAEGYIDY